MLLFLSFDCQGAKKIGLKAHWIRPVLSIVCRDAETVFPPSARLRPWEPLARGVQAAASAADTDPLCNVNQKNLFKKSLLSVLSHTDFPGLFAAIRKPTEPGVFAVIPPPMRRTAPNDLFHSSFSLPAFPPRSIFRSVPSVPANITPSGRDKFRCAHPSVYSVADAGVKRLRC